MYYFGKMFTCVLRNDFYNITVFEKQKNMDL